MQISTSHIKKVTKQAKCDLKQILSKTNGLCGETELKSRLSTDCPPDKF